MLPACTGSKLQAVSTVGGRHYEVLMFCGCLYAERKGMVNPVVALKLQLVADEESTLSRNMALFAGGAIRLFVAVITVTFR